jgi:hypothetical protein
MGSEYYQNLNSPLDVGENFLNFCRLDATAMTGCLFVRPCDVRFTF